MFLSASVSHCVSLACLIRLFGLDDVSLCTSATIVRLRSRRTVVVLGRF
ncbi:unnamed protein product [Ixodes pacificus]